MLNLRVAALAYHNLQGPSGRAGLDMNIFCSSYRSSESPGPHWRDSAGNTQIFRCKTVTVTTSFAATEKAAAEREADSNDSDWTLILR